MGCLVLKFLTKFCCSKIYFPYMTKYLPRKAEFEILGTVATLNIVLIVMVQVDLWATIYLMNNLCNISCF